MNKGDTSWVLISTALVLFMTPGLALFYGGMVRGKNVLGMLMQNFFAMGILAVLWVAVVFSLAFGDAGNAGWIGNLDFAFLNDVGQGAGGGELLRVPDHSVRLVLRVPDDVRDHHAGADHRRDGRPVEVQRLRGVHRASGWCVVYAPVAHWVFAGGWLADMGALDFAGGAVVHINAGCGGARARAHARRSARAIRTHAMPPHNLPMTMIGTGILWFGWAGFNAGSALAADGSPPSRS